MGLDLIWNRLDIELFQEIELSSLNRSSKIYLNSMLTYLEKNKRMEHHLIDVLSLS